MRIDTEGYGGFVNKKQQVQWSMLGVIGVEGAWQKGERILYALGKNILKSINYQCIFNREKAACIRAKGRGLGWLQARGHE